jgi:hypothetical protein
MIDTYQRASRFTELKPYCLHAREGDYMEVTEWHNGDGYDVLISGQGGDQRFSLTHGQWECLTVLLNYREKA